MSDNPFDPKSVEQLPRVLPIFPLAGATLLPGTQLPLNIFEPRYLSMVLDALGADRNIGMIQPEPGDAESDEDSIYSVGCAGRITAMNETEDGRLLISLQGVCRFRVAAELESVRGYRRVQPDWRPYLHDLGDESSFVLDRNWLKAEVREYLSVNGIRVDWDALEKMPDRRIVDFLAMHLPFAPEEKQALVEASDADARAKTLVTVTRMGAQTATAPGPTRH